jgi:hypothetical protein
MDDLKENIEFKGLVMRAVPDRTRKDFKKLAFEEFDGHYGVTLREVLDDYFEYKLLKQLLLNSNINLTKLIKEEK